MDAREQRGLEIAARFKVSPAWRLRRRPALPICLDDAIFAWDHALQADVVRRHVGDFRKWTDPTAYRAALERLIRDLRKETGA